MMNGWGGHRTLSNTYRRNNDNAARESSVVGCSSGSNSGQTRINRVVMVVCRS